MIEVSIGFGNANGDGLLAFTVDVGPHAAFDTAPTVRAVHAALAEFAKQEPRGAVHSICLRPVSQTVLEAKA